MSTTVSKYTVRTSGRRTFRRCMRKWGFQSSMRMNLQKKGTETNIHFWFGSAIHFAMEDFFGYNRFGDLTKAFQAYYAAFPAAERPPGADEHYFLGMGMLEYFKEWYSRKNDVPKFQTVWLNADNQEVEPGAAGARPLIEESFILDLGKKTWARQDTGEVVHIDPDCLLYDREEGYHYILLDEHGKQVAFLGTLWEATRTQVVVKEVPVYYHGTLDRVVRDSKGRWWIMDWKTAKGADTGKLDTDDQISAYLWAAEQWFGHPIEGFIYVQLTKKLAKEPKRLVNGSFSVDKKQDTTYATVKRTLLAEYGDMKKVPNKYIDFLNFQTTKETPEGDQFIRWDAVRRTKEQKESTFQHILGEVELMLNPNLYLFPNFTRDCSWDCNFRETCMMMDDGKTAEAMFNLQQDYEQRPREEDGNIDSWREDIPWPDSSKYEAVGTLVKQMELDASAVLNIILPEGYGDDGRD